MLNTSNISKVGTYHDAECLTKQTKITVLGKIMNLVGY